MAGPIPRARHLASLLLALALASACSGSMLNGSDPVAVHVAAPGVDPGACMRFAPTSGSSGPTVFLDPGHGGPDPGVVGDAGGRQLLEKDVTLAVARRLTAMLRADGYRVVMSRVSDTSVARLGAADSVDGVLTPAAVHRDLVARAACANAASSSVLLSIHFNAFHNPSVGGAETFYDTARPFSAASKRLATAVQAAVAAGVGAEDRGVWTDDDSVGPALTPRGSNYGHLIELGPASPGWVDDPSGMPGALVEPLFLTNAAEARYAADAAGQEKIAAALKKGLEMYLAGS